MIHHSNTDSLRREPVRFVLLNDPMPCVLLCASVVLHSPLRSCNILSWPSWTTAGPLNSTLIHYWPRRAPSQNLPITLPWRWFGQVVVIAGVWHSVARRKLRVNVGGKTRQQSDAKRSKELCGKMCVGLHLKWKVIWVVLRDAWKFAEQWCLRCKWCRVISA